MAKKAKQTPTAADAWLAEYMRPEAIASRKIFEVLREGLKEGKRLPSSNLAKSGLPPSFPLPEFDEENDFFWINRSACQEAARRAFENGYGEALLTYCLWHFENTGSNRSKDSVVDAIRLAAKKIVDECDDPHTVRHLAAGIRDLAAQMRYEAYEESDDDLPLWARNALAAAFELWRDRETDTLDDALNLVHEAGQPEATRRGRVLARELRAAEKEARGRGIKGDALLEALGKVGNASVSKVKGLLNPNTRKRKGTNT